MLCSPPPATTLASSCAGSQGFCAPCYRRSSQRSRIHNRPKTGRTLLLHERLARMRLSSTLYRVYQQQNCDCWAEILLMQALTVTEAAEIGLGETHREMRGLRIIAAAENLAMGIDPGQSASVAERHVKPHGAETGVEPAIDQLQQPVAALSRYGG